MHPYARIGLGGCFGPSWTSGLFRSTRSMRNGMRKPIGSSKYALTISKQNVYMVNIRLDSVQSTR